MLPVLDLDPMVESAAAVGAVAVLEDQQQNRSGAGARGRVTSLDHLVSAGEQHRWHFEAERFRSLEIDTQLEFGRSVKRDISRIGTSKNLIDEVGEAAIHVRLVNRISHQSANFDEFAERINCGNPAFRRQFDNRRTIGERARLHQIPRAHPLDLVPSI